MQEGEGPRGVACFLRKFQFLHWSLGAAKQGQGWWARARDHGGHSKVEVEQKLQEDRGSAPRDQMYIWGLKEPISALGQNPSRCLPCDSQGFALTRVLYEGLRTWQAGPFLAHVTEQRT